MAEKNESRSLPRRLANRLFWIPYFRYRLSRMTERDDIDKLVEWGFSPLCSRFMAPMQVKSELRKLLQRISDLKPRYIAEIGTCGGGLFFQFTRICASDSTLISIDLPGGPFGGGMLIDNVKSLQQARLPGQTLHFIRDDSHKSSTFDQVEGLLKGHPLDVLFIDGDHSYEGVKHDYEMYGPLVRKGGLIGFHDIVLKTNDPNIEVGRFWPELKMQVSDWEEIVENWDQGGYGIGLIRKS